MNPEHVVAVAVRLFAIGLTVYAVTGAVGLGGNGKGIS